MTLLNPILWSACLLQLCEPRGHAARFTQINNISFNIKECSLPLIRPPVLGLISCRQSSQSPPPRGLLSSSIYQSPSHPSFPPHHLPFYALLPSLPTFHTYFASHCFLTSFIIFLPFTFFPTNPYSCLRLFLHFPFSSLKLSSPMFPHQKTTIISQIVCSEAILGAWCEG